MTTRDYERFWVTTSDYKWVRVTTRDYQWLRARLRVTTSDYEWLQATTSHYKWLQVTTSQAMSDYKWPRMTKRLPVKLRMTTTGIGNKLRHKNVYFFLWLHNNERNKYVEKGPKIVVLRFWWKSLKNTCDAESSRLQMFFKVSALKKAFNPASFLKRDSNTRVFQWNSQNL